MLNLCCALQNEDYNLSPLTILEGLGAKFSVGLFLGIFSVLNVWRWGQLKSSEGAESLRHPQHSLPAARRRIAPKLPKIPTSPIPKLHKRPIGIYSIFVSNYLTPLILQRLVSNSKLSRFKGFCFLEASWHQQSDFWRNTFLV